MMDLHNHSRFSFDSKTDMEDIIKSAIDNKLDYIAITDHLDLKSPDEDYSDILDISSYFKEIDRLKKIYNNDIDILSAVEIGLDENLSKTYEDIIDNWDYDFVLGSIHSIGGKDLIMDNLYKKYDTDDFYKLYYSHMQKMVEDNGVFDILGHLDYIDRYFPNKEEILPIENYFEYIEPIFKSLISRFKGIEINTASFRNNLDYYHPKISALQLYKSLGGEIITIGSDGHISEDIGFKIYDAIRMLKGEGFNKVHIFKDRLPVEIYI